MSGRRKDRPPAQASHAPFHKDYMAISQSFREHAMASASTDIPVLHVDTLNIQQDLTDANLASCTVQQPGQRRPGEGHPVRPAQGTPSSMPVAASTACTSPSGLDLPKLVIPNIEDNDVDAALLREASPKFFETTTLCAAFQAGCSLEAIAEYLHGYDNRREVLKNRMKEPICGGCTTPLFYAIEYAIEHNCAAAVGMVLEYRSKSREYIQMELESSELHHVTELRGTCLPEHTEVCRIPPLAFAIIRGKEKFKNPLDVVKALLSYGALPSRKPIGFGPLGSLAVTLWEARRDEAVDISQLYVMQPREDGKKIAQGLKARVATEYNMWDLLTIDLHMIGQKDALRLVKDNLLCHAVMNVRRPLVMAFAGPSGHGKTELAQQMGKLLSLETMVVDGAHMRHDTALFGPHGGYKRSEQGSPLNNFLAKHNGKRAVVFLDEFDKTPQEIRHSLLLVCDSGIYYDRRSNKKVDCSKMLWIIATNLGDEPIKRFFAKKMEAQSSMPIEPLQDDLMATFSDTFGAPFTGRVDLVVPFLPFNPLERTVVAHSLLLKLADELRQPVVLVPGSVRMLGHIQLDIGNGAKIADHIAKTYYQVDTGARSLRRGVDDIRCKLVAACFKVHTNPASDEMHDGLLRRYVVELRQRLDGKEETVVQYGGAIPYGGMVPMNDATTHGPKTNGDTEVDTDSSGPSSDSSFGHEEEKYLRYTGAY